AERLSPRTLLGAAPHQFHLSLESLQVMAFITIRQTELPDGNQNTPGRGLGEKLARVRVVIVDAAREVIVQHFARATHVPERIDANGTLHFHGSTQLGENLD